MHYDTVRGQYEILYEVLNQLVTHYAKPADVK